jgi:hypothetical protein
VTRTDLRDLALCALFVPVALWTLAPAPVRLLGSCAVWAYCAVGCRVLDAWARVAAARQEV